MIFTSLTISGFIEFFFTKNIDFLPYFYLEKYLRNCILFDSFDEDWLFEIPLLAGSILEFNLFIKNIQFITIFFTILKKLNTIWFIWELMNTTSKNIDFLPYFYLGKIFQKLHIIWFICWRWLFIIFISILINTSKSINIYFLPIFGLYLKK